MKNEMMLSNKSAFGYINKQLKQREILDKNCSRFERKDLAISYLEEKKVFKVKLKFYDLEKRLNAKMPRLNDTKCFIQKFNKKSNQSESNQKLVFEQKLYFTPYFEILTNTTGYFYVECTHNTSVIYNDVLTIWPQNMSDLFETRAEYKRTVDKFRREKVFPKFGSLINNVDYGKACATNQTHPRVKPNFLFIGIDSISLRNFQRIFPNTYKYLNELDDNIIFERMNSAGTSTIDNIIQLLTGLNRKELNQHLDKKIDDTFCDYLPFVWEEFESQGYLTAYQEDWPNIGIFNYLRKGFR